MVIVSEGRRRRDVRRVVSEQTDESGGRGLCVQGRRRPVAMRGPYDIRGDRPQSASSCTPEPPPSVSRHPPRGRHRADSSHGNSAGELCIAFRCRLSVQWILSCVIINSYCLPERSQPQYSLSVLFLKYSQCYSWNMYVQLPLLIKNFLLIVSWFLGVDRVTLCTLANADVSDRGPSSSGQTTC